MANLTIKKKKARRLLTNKISEGNDILLKISKIQNQSEFTKMIDEHELWWNSVGELLKQIFDDERVADNFQNVDVFVPNQKSLNQRISDFKNDVQNDLNKIQQVISDINNEIYSSKKKFEFTYDGIIDYLKKNRVVAIILVAIVIFIGVTKLLESYVKAKKNINEITNEFKTKDTADVNEIDTVGKMNEKLSITRKEIILLDSIKLPYLENITILDKGLYIRYDYNNLDFGGVNIDTVSINARSRDGNSLKINKSSNILEIDLTKEPYIEFEYKGTYYSIETNGQHYSFYCTLRKNIELTMRLIEFAEIE